MIDRLLKHCPIRVRREEEKEERRRQILDAAEVVIAREGWTQAHFGEVAKEARLSRSLVYFYFKTKDELFHAVCGRGLLELERRFRALRPLHVLGIDQIMAIGREYHRFSLECPLYFTLLSDYQAREAAEEDLSATEKEANEQGKACLARVAESLGLGLQDGSIRASIGDPARAAVTIWAFTHGLIQITNKKQKMLERDLGTTSELAMDHGFALLRETLVNR